MESSGHKYKFTKNVNLAYKKPKETSRKRKPRNIMYFNPPFSKSVSTNVIKLFFDLIDKYFLKGHKLHKCFNRNKVKAYLSKLFLFYEF